MAGPMKALRRSMRDGAAARMSVVYRASSGAPSSWALAPGVEALDVEAFVMALRNLNRKFRKLKNTVKLS